MQSKKTFLTHNDVKDIFNDIYDKFVTKAEIGKEKIRTDEEWEYLIDLANLLDKKYNCPLAKHLILGCMETLDTNEHITRTKQQQMQVTSERVDISDLAKPEKESTENQNQNKPKYSSFKKVR